MNVSLVVEKLALHKSCYATPRARNLLLAFLASAGIATCFLGAAGAQTAASGASQGAKAPAAAPRPAPARATKIEANLQQLMRGILFPSSNVVFAAQGDLTKLEKAPDPSLSANPLTSTYGGWLAVENAALAISESANLIVLTGRLCANGKPVPVQRADWVKYSQGLQTASMEVYKAAQKKDTDAIVDASGTLSDACSACHDVYREKQAVKDRCTP